MDDIPSILEELRANLVWKCATCLATGTYGDEKPADEWGPPTSHVCEETDDPEEKIRRYVRTELNAQYKEYIKSLPWWCVLCGEGGNYIGDRPDYYWFPPRDHVCKEREPTPRENATSTLQRIIKQITINDDQKIGKIVKTENDEKGISVEIELNERGKNLFTAMDEDYQKLMERLRTRINYLPPYSLKDFDDHGRY